MSQARDEVLGRARQALGRAAAGSSAPAPWRLLASSGPRPPSTTPTSEQQLALLDLFSERVEDYGARVSRVTDASEIARAVGGALGGAITVVVPADLDGSWLPPGTAVTRDSAGMAAASLDGFAATVTGCALAIAETGTIVLDGSGSQGRRALTLVPDHHICVVTETQLVSGVGEALVRLDPKRPLTWISGPSATSDIELSRVQGVHGPRRLDVIVVAAWSPLSY